MLNWLDAFSRATISSKSPTTDLKSVMTGMQSFFSDLTVQTKNQFTDLVDIAQADPYSFFGKAFAQRANLKDELGEAGFQALVAVAKEKPNSLLAIALAERPNLKAELEGLVDIPKIDPGFQTCFTGLDSTLQNQFGTWLDTIFTQVLPEDISTETKTQIRTQALAYFPQTIRAKIQAGLFPDQTVQNSIDA